MGKVRTGISVSLDGFVAGPNQSLEHPLGEGGMQLHEWVFPLKAFREAHGEIGGETNSSNEVLTDVQSNIGSYIMGRNMFGGYPGVWKRDPEWKGWWGDTPPFRCPVFVLTNFPREPLLCEGDTTFTFVTEGSATALKQAQSAAGLKDVFISGGAETVNQYLRAGVVDQLDLHLVPILLGQGERLFHNVGRSLHGLKLERAIHGDGVVHLRFVR